MSDTLFALDAPPDLEFQSYPASHDTPIFGKRRPLPGNTLYAKGDNEALYGYGALDSAQNVCYRRSNEGVITILARGLEEADARKFLRIAHRMIAMSGHEPVSLRWPVHPESAKTTRLSVEPIAVAISRKADGSIEAVPLSVGAKPVKIEKDEVAAFLSGDSMPQSLRTDEMSAFANTMRAELLTAMRNSTGFLSPEERLVAGMTVAVLRMQPRAKDTGTLEGIRMALKDIAIRVSPALSGGEIDAVDVPAVMSSLRVLMRGEPGRVFGEDGAAIIVSDVTPLMQTAIASMSRQPAVRARAFA